MKIKKNYDSASSTQDNNNRNNEINLTINQVDTDNHYQLLIDQGIEKMGENSDDELQLEANDSEHFVELLEKNNKEKKNNMNN